MTGKELNKWADDFMFTAEKSDASLPPKAYLLGAPVDPLGQIAACAKMYKGQVVRDLADVTDEERLEYLEQIQKTVLKMPLEAVSLHFMVEGVHRGITHQMVRQRTAAFAQESTRFAVKEDLTTATALPPSLQGTLSKKDFADVCRREAFAAGIPYVTSDSDEHVIFNAPRRLKTKLQMQRLRWEDAVEKVGKVYNELVNDGMPAEEARGLMPTNITTRLNYITNLRSFYDTMAVRVSDQAQFEWRQVAMAYAVAMREYGEDNFYHINVNGERRTKSSAWQYEALTNEIKPVEFKMGKRAFGANFDRPSRIGERVDAFAKMGVPSDRWTQGAPEFNIPPIHPEEWLLDPNSARLDSTQEFDIYGNRVAKGTGVHWVDGELR